MRPSERAIFKGQLSAMVAGRGNGIELDSPERWIVENLRDPISFFRNLHLLIPEASILYFEAINIVPEVARFYETNRATVGAVGVARDMIYPVPEIFHVPMRAEVTERLIELLQKHPLENCFTHLKAYRQETLLVSFHDAFDGSNLLLSDHIPSERIEAFCKKLGSSFRREPNDYQRNARVLQALLRAMENPEKVRILWPWWKRALLFWKK